jgi:ferredoxin-NADP reductase
MNVVFERKEQHAPDIWQYYFKTDRPLSFVPGQYVDVQLPHSNPDNRGMSRTFTLTSLPGEALMSFAVKFSETMSTYKQALYNIRTGQSATITDAMGDLVLPKSPTVPLVYVAGGLGIASFVSMVRWLTTHDDKRTITLLYALHDTQDALFQDIFSSYPFKIEMKLYSPVTERLTAKLIADAMPADGLIYISGTEKFVELLRSNLQTELHIPHQQIVFDFFDGYADL